MVLPKSTHLVAEVVGLVEDVFGPHGGGLPSPRHELGLQQQGLSGLNKDNGKG